MLKDGGKNNPTELTANMPTNSPPAISGGPKSFRNFLGSQPWENAGILAKLDKFGASKPNTPAIVKRVKREDGSYSYTVLRLAKYYNRKIVDIDDRPVLKTPRSYTKTTITIIR